MTDNIKNILEQDTTGILPEIVVKKFRPASYSSYQDGHFAIGVDDYAHFTSPIRRYADVLIHRILMNAVNGKKAIIPNIENDCKHITNRERRAERVEKYASKINALKFVKNIDYTLQSKIIYFSKKGILVKTDLMIDGWINSEDLEGYNYDEKQNKWVHDEYNLKLGDIISTKVCRLDWDRNEIYLKLV
jgi:ribonuclease R